MIVLEGPRGCTNNWSTNLCLLYKHREISCSPFLSVPCAPCCCHSSGSFFYEGEGKERMSESSPTCKSRPTSISSWSFHSIAGFSKCLLSARALHHLFQISHMARSLICCTSGMAYLFTSSRLLCWWFCNTVSHGDCQLPPPCCWSPGLVPYLADIHGFCIVLC